MIHPGHGHAPDNVIIHVPSRRFLFGGCAVVGMPRLGYLHDAELASWPAAMRRMQALRPRVVVPGDGERTDPGVLRHTLRLIRDHQRSGTRP